MFETTHTLAFWAIAGIYKALFLAFKSCPLVLVFLLLSFVNVFLQLIELE